MYVVCMIQIRIIREKRSYDFKLNQALDTFANNIKNNLIDTILITNNNDVVFKARCQSVANYPGAFKDTIKEGKFQVKCFVKPITMHGEIHAIINTFDIDNQSINHDSYQVENNITKGRWLIHNTFYNGKDLQYAYSAGCVMLRVKDMEEFNKCLKDLNVGANDILNGILTEV